MSNKPTIRSRVVVLCNDNLHTRATVATLISAGVNVVGYVEASTGRNISRTLATIRRQGVFLTVGRALSRLAYFLFDRRRDEQLYERIFDRARVTRTLAEWGGPKLGCERYGTPEAVGWINDLAPDIIVVHSGTWVSKSVRALARSGMVIGGHPGITPNYRGGNSSFWALYFGRPDDVGWSVFALDAGVDTGPVFAQGRTAIDDDDSFVSLDWKGMTHIAREQAALIRRIDAGETVTPRPHPAIPGDSLFFYPTLTQFLRYRMRQARVR